MLPQSLIGDIAGLSRAKAGRAAAHRLALEGLSFVRLAALAGTSAASLAYDQQKRLELGADSKRLLLDEPAASLSNCRPPGCHSGLFRFPRQWLSRCWPWKG